ncbi:conserved hypothetical protein [Ricinus communis]|uniref:Uncharacterized protein n=1 Tax=Ricinus communis TaxID=3988 RepID=B9RHS7_RICCO|nr:conserved hypothetical protein [Ricinus communis]
MQQKGEEEVQSMSKKMEDEDKTIPPSLRFVSGKKESIFRGSDQTAKYGRQTENAICSCRAGLHTHPETVGAKLIKFL